MQEVEERGGEDGRCGVGAGDDEGGGFAEEFGGGEGGAGWGVEEVGVEVADSGRTGDAGGGLDGAVGFEFPHAGCEFGGDEGGEVKG